MEYGKHVLLANFIFSSYFDSNMRSLEEASLKWRNMTEKSILPFLRNFLPYQ